jgi:hypothetical protein
VNAPLRAVVFVYRVDEELDRVMRYLAYLGTDSVRAVHLGETDAVLGAEFWARYGHALEFAPPSRRSRGRGAVRRARALVRAEHATEPDGLLAVVVAGSRDRSSGLVERANERRVRAGMLNESGVMLVNMP